MTAAVGTQVNGNGTRTAMTAAVGAHVNGNGA
jgi:hypothetical protein